MNTTRTFLPIILLALTVAQNASAADAATFIELPFCYVIGGHAKGKWLTSEQSGKAIKPDAEFRVYDLQTETGKTKFIKAGPDADVCPDVWIAKFDTDPDKHGIALSASWNPLPRPVTSANKTQEPYVKAVKDILISKGIKNPVVKITQHLRADLDGDGEEEVLLAATHYSNDEGDMGAPMQAAQGNYSFVAMRRVVAGKVVTQIFDGEFYEKPKDSNAPNIHEIGGLLDLDGDGRMEILLHSTYYEGGGTTVWQLGAQKTIKVLDIVCGV